MNLFLMPSPNELFSHPLRWAGKHLAFYVLASAVAGALFVAGAGLYSHFVPAAPVVDQPPPLRAPSIPPEPVKSAPPSLVPEPVDPGSVVASNHQEIPFNLTLGAKVMDSKGAHLGWVREMSVTPNGLATVTIEKRNGAAVKVPADSFSWTKSTDIKVEAVVKPTVDYRSLFGG